MANPVDKILGENRRRLDLINAPFDPLTGEGSIGERFILSLPDFPIQKQWLPVSMRDIPLVQELQNAGSIADFLTTRPEFTPGPTDASKVARALIRLRYLHDFPFWAASVVHIKRKGGGPDVLFRLTLPQRRFVSLLEQMRLASRPIRVILLKARQWGGSTTSQMYMAWLQLVHRKGLNSLIIAHVRDGSIQIKDMFDRMLAAYPAELLHPMGSQYHPDEQKTEGVGASPNLQRIIARNCTIKVGTAEKPDSCRGGDYSLVHLSEVGMWTKTEGRSPEDIVQSACSGILLQPYTMVVYESTANGTGNFFQREYDAAKDPAIPSQFTPLFISWFDIPQYSMPFASDAQRREFADALWRSRRSELVPSARQESGRYLYHLFELGATLEGIHWYIEERKGKNAHAVMASEYPSDDVEAFVHSGSMVFNLYSVDALHTSCRAPRMIGEIYSATPEGPSALEKLRFHADEVGALKVWALPDISETEIITDRYLTVVDVGGRSSSADFSVIAVFDRLDMLPDGDGRPAIVAQWRGHCDIDQLAWHAARIAAFYDNSLLVIESNTLETRDRDRAVDGDQSLFILNQIKDVYPNLYERRASEEEIREGMPRKYGFHTNVATKPMIISTLVRAVRERLWTERDADCIDELKTYERKPNGAYGAIIGKHDDILMTRAIGLHICFNEMPLPTIQPASRLNRPEHQRPVSEASF